MDRPGRKPGEGEASLSEAAARRVLDRAVEVDAKLRDQVSMRELREIAHASEISEEALQLALAEHHGTAVPSSQERAAGRPAPAQGSGVGRTIAGLGATIGSLLAATALAIGISASWEVTQVLQILSMLAGAGMSLRMRAPTAAAASAGAAGGAFVSFIVAGMSGPFHNDGATHVTLVLLGALLGVLARVALGALRRSDALPTVTPAFDESARS